MEYVNITKSTVKCHDIYLHQRVKLRMGAHSSIHKKLIPRNVWIDISWKYPSLRVSIPHRFKQTYQPDSPYTGCPGGNVPDFGRMFLTLKYTDLTQNTYIRS